MVLLDFILFSIYLLFILLSLFFIQKLFVFLDFKYIILNGEEVAEYKKEQERAKEENSPGKGHFLILMTLAVTLFLPLIIIILSYNDIINGISEFSIKMAVFASAAMIVGGTLVMMVQDKKDGENK